MAEQFNGKWKVVRAENCKQFFKDLGTFPDEELLKDWPDIDDAANDFIDDVTVTKDAIEVHEYSKGNKMDSYKYPFNEDYRETRGGMDSIVKASRVGNKVTLVDNGKSYIAKHVREVNGDDMTLTSTSNKSSCIGLRVFKKIKA